MCHSFPPKHNTMSKLVKGIWLSSLDPSVFLRRNRLCSEGIHFHCRFVARATVLVQVYFLFATTSTNTAARNSKGSVLNVLIVKFKNICATADGNLPLHSNSNGRSLSGFVRSPMIHNRHSFSSIFSSGLMHKSTTGDWLTQNKQQWSRRSNSHGATMWFIDVQKGKSIKMTLFIPVCSFFYWICDKKTINQCIALMLLSRNNELSSLHQNHVTTLDSNTNISYSIQLYNPQRPVWKTVFWMNTREDENCTTLCKREQVQGLSR